MGLQFARWPARALRLGTVVALAGPSFTSTAVAQSRVVIERELSSGRIESVEHTLSASGGVFVWVESSAFDPRLVVTFGDGTRLTDDDTGGGTTGWLRRTCAAGERLAIAVEAKLPDASGAARIVIQEMPDTDASRRGSKACLDALREAEAIAASGDHTAAAKLLREAALGLLQTPGIEFDADAHGSLWKAERKLDEWGDTASMVEISRVLVRFVRAHYPPHSRAVVQQLNALCGGLMSLDRAAEAIPWCEESVAAAELSFGADSDDTAVARINYGFALNGAGRRERAKGVVRSALDTIERLYGTQSTRWAEMAGQYGVVLNELGELDESRRIQERALAVLSKALDPSSAARMSLEGNLAATLDALGDPRGALEIHEGLARRYEGLLGREHPITRLSRHNVAVCRLKLGERDAALAEFEALDAASRAAGEQSSGEAELGDAARAEALLQLGHFEDALAVARRRAELRSSEGRTDPNGEWRFTALEARALVGLGRRDEAATAAMRALAAVKLAFPPENPDVAEARLLAAGLALERGQREAAFAMSLESSDATRAYFDRCAMTLSMRQAEAVQANWSRLVSDGITLLSRTAPESERDRAAAAAFELAESARGIGTALLRAGAASAAAELEPLRAEVRDAASEVARAGANDLEAEALEAVVARKEVAERALRDALARIRGGTLERRDARATAASLGEGEALVAYWRHDVRELGADAIAPRAPRLLAFVATRGSAVQTFDLGPLEPIAAAALAWRRAAASGDPDSAAAERSAGSTLAIDPLLPRLRDARAWRVAADDVLHLVALDALPSGEGRLGDSVSLTHVVAPSFVPTAPSTGAASEKVFVAVGGVDYDSADEGDASPRIAAVPLEALAMRGGPWREGFAELWATQQEVEDLARLFREGRESARCVFLEERSATKRELVAAVPHATYLHVATHGFVALDEGEAPPLARRSPLALCGLALAGANAGPDEHGFEGVITAEELATLDLSRCELVVLSACDTHAGQVSAGQGVASFQKALHAAGARVVVTSLWKVSDETTRALMASFYGALWRDGATPEAALWTAKRALRERRAPVRDWAGWILSRP